MLEKFISITYDIISTGGPVGVFVAAILEEIVFFIPSALIPMGAGFFLLPSELVFWDVASRAIFVVALPVAFGLTIGSLIPYCLCYFGGRPAIERWGSWIGLSWARLEKIQQSFSRGYRDELLIFGLRLLPIIPSVLLSSLCGLVRYPIWRFLIITFCGAALRGWLLGLLGWYAGSTYEQYAHSFDRFENLIVYFLAFIGSSLLAWMIFKKTKKSL